jgi:hypothetical protein
MHVVTLKLIYSRMDKPRDTDENIGHKTHSEDNNKKKQKNQSEQTNKQKTACRCHQAIFFK